MKFSFKFFHFKEEDVRVHCTLFSKGENLKSGIRVRITPLLPPLCGLHVSFLLPCVLHVFLYSYVHNVHCTVYSMLHVSFLSFLQPCVLHVNFLYASLTDTCPLSTFHLCLLHVSFLLSCPLHVSFLQPCVLQYVSP